MTTKLHHIHAAAAATRVEFEEGSISLTWRGEGSGSLALKRDMARRLAVCWNVLEGVPTEALEGGMLTELCLAVAAGDMPRAQRALSVVDRAVELTADGKPHACTACSKREQLEQP